LPTSTSIWDGDSRLQPASPQGIADAVRRSASITTVERLLSKCNHLTLLAAPATLSGSTTSPEAFDRFRLLRTTVPFTVLDVPIVDGWTKHTLIAADETLTSQRLISPISAMPKHADLLKHRAPMRAPILPAVTVVPKRPEITSADFAKAVDQPIAVIPFEPQLFGAANNGQMIAELSASHRLPNVPSARCRRGAETKTTKSSLLSPLLGKLLKRA
jgi:pilus assembly protein CpaE